MTKQEHVQKLTDAIEEISNAIPVVNAGIDLTPSEPLLSILLKRSADLRAAREKLQSDLDIISQSEK